MTLSWPPKRTGWFVPGITAAAPSCSPTKAPSKVTGFVPKAFESRRRAWRLQMSGRTISRNDWSRAPVAAAGKWKLWSGCADGLPIG